MAIRPLLEEVKDGFKKRGFTELWPFFKHFKAFQTVEEG